MDYIRLISAEAITVKKTEGYGERNARVITAVN
jgi:hypothetical protein